MLEIFNKTSQVTEVIFLNIIVERQFLQLQIRSCQEMCKNQFSRAAQIFQESVVTKLPLLIAFLGQKTN